MKPPWTALLTFISLADSAGLIAGCKPRPNIWAVLHWDRRIDARLKWYCTGGTTHSRHGPYPDGEYRSDGTDIPALSAEKESAGWMQRPQIGWPRNLA